MYKKTVLSLSFIFLFLQAVLVSAQQPVQSNPTQNNGSIIEELNTARSGQGNVTIYQDEALKDILAKPAPANLPVFSTGDGSVQYVKMRGYKIQVFSGNEVMFEIRKQFPAFGKEMYIISDTVKIPL